MPLDIRILGPLEVERDGEVLGIGGRRQRAVLAVLLLHAREAMSPERLADAVWDGQPPASADTTLRGYVSNLRKILEPDRAAGQEPRILRTSSAGYVLDVPNEAIDARRFERLVADGRDRRAAGELDATIGTWVEALALWRGEALQDFAYEAFAQPETTRLTELRLACTEDLLEARIESGHHDAVTGELEFFCAANPDRERALRLWMLALYRCGRQSDALRVYEQGRKRLADELGVDPSAELRGLHEQIVRQDPGIAAPAAVRDSAASGPQPPVRQTLTFLLCDVERSTETLRALGDEYAGVLQMHRRLLHGVFEEHDGRAIRASGDEAFAAFEVATDAVSAAVAAQVVLRRTIADEERRLRVRMGLHTGEAVFSDGQHVGLAVHLAARIMSAAHGGQILISQATKELYEGEQGAEIGFLDSGSHRLKDIPDAVRLFQVVHPELPGDFPGLRTRADRTDNLPTRLTSFVGRDRDLEEIETTLVKGRILTLTGVGGVGKTRLAIEAANRLIPRYADGAWLCDLVAVGDPDALVHRVASTLGVQQQHGRSMRESVLAAVGQRSSLLVLDNCEHLLGPVAELVEDIVGAGLETDVLATSREALGVEGERSWPVRSLRVSAGEATIEAEAVQLFTDRARAARPDFDIDDRNAADVADICVRLDGIPLAIELAAARVTSLSPAQIAARLEEGFHFLRSGRRAAVDRHRTLHGAIDWSYALLSESERLLFDRLSVFAGGFTLDAAEAVCGAGLDLDVADGLASLVGKSMVDADISGIEARYSMLETMRQYAQDRLTARGEADETLRAHATYFANLVEAESDITRADSERGRARVVAEFDNLRAAQAWTLASGDVDLAMRILAVDAAFHLSTMPPDRADDVMEMPGAEDHPLLPTVMAVAAMGAERRGDLTRARELLARALEIVDDPDDPRRLGVLYWRVAVSRYEGNLDEAKRWHAEYLRAARACRDLLHQASAHWVGSLVEATAGDHAAATELAEAGYELANHLSSAAQGCALYFLGEALNQSGRQVERALDCLDRSIALCRANEMHFWVGVALVSSTSLRARHGDPLESLGMFADIIDRWRRSGDWARQWVTLLNLAELFGRTGVDLAATTLLAAAEASSQADTTAGPQGMRIAALRDRLAERMGEEAFAAARDCGRAMSDEEAVAYAKAEIARALERTPAEV